MKYLTLHDVLYVHQKVIEVSGGSFDVRDIGLIDSAVNRPHATFNRKELYKTLFEKAAALFHSVIFNHAFLDGNKRTAIACASQMLYLNGFELLTSNKELESFTLRIVAHKLEITDIAAWLKKNSKSF